MIKRKICVVITARPSYSRIKTALRSIVNHPNLELQLVVAGSALSSRYGSVVKFITKDKFEISAKVFNLLEADNLASAAKTTGLGILELSSVFENLKPDFVVTVADRYETVSTAISAAYMNIPLVHIQGGEVTGNIDEKVRHAITKLADYHFVSSDDAYQRVIKLGENPQNVFNTGCPSIDLASEVKENPTMNFDPYEKYGGVGTSPNLHDGYIVVMQHPVTNEHVDSRKQINETLYAMREIDLPVLWFWPNVDTGADGTSSGIRAFRERFSVNHIHFFKNMDGEDFLRLLYNSKGLIGNSSVGIRECAYLGIPVVNIGTRQNKRARGENVVDVDYKSEDILKATNRVIKSKKSNPSLIYGEGNAGEVIADLLAEIDPIFHKIIQY